MISHSLANALFQATLIILVPKNEKKVRLEGECLFVLSIYSTYSSVQSTANGFQDALDRLYTNAFDPS